MFGGKRGFYDSEALLIGAATLRVFAINANRVEGGFQF